MLKDSTGTKSTTQTLLIISFILLCVGCGLEIAGVVSNTSALPELFFGCLAAYTGRRMKFSKLDAGSNSDK
jgi:hypothetical protein